MGHIHHGGRIGLPQKGQTLAHGGDGHDFKATRFKDSDGSVHMVSVGVEGPRHASQQRQARATWLPACLLLQVLLETREVRKDRFVTQVEKHILRHRLGWLHLVREQALSVQHAAGVGLQARIVHRTAAAQVGRDGIEIDALQAGEHVMLRVGGTVHIDGRS